PFQLPLGVAIQASRLFGEIFENFPAYAKGQAWRRKHASDDPYRKTRALAHAPTQSPSGAPREAQCLSLLVERAQSRRQNGISDLTNFGVLSRPAGGRGFAFGRVRSPFRAPAGHVESSASLIPDPAHADLHRIGGKMQPLFEILSPARLIQIVR